MKVGDYVRTKNGTIVKIKNEDYLYIFETEYREEYKVVKSSPNIIDLIEAGDYVNGSKVYSGVSIDIDDYGNDFKEVYVESDKYIYHSIREENIKSIVTKEQFESMQYKVGDE